MSARPSRRARLPPSPASGRAGAAGCGDPERVIEQIPDDRLDIEPGDTILLIVEDDPHYARVLIDLARDKGFKVLVAMRGADALDLAKQFQPTAVSLDVFLPDMLGWTVLSQLKQNPLTRHIPVQIITLDEDRQHALARGAFSFVTKPTTTEGVEAALSRIKEYAKPRRKRLLVVEDNAGRADEHPRAARSRRHRDRHRRHRRRRARRRCATALRLRGARSAAAGHDRLRGARPDPQRRCAVGRAGGGVHRAANLSAEEDAQLHTMARSIVVKGVESPERLLDETSLFLHRVVTELPAEKQRMLERLNSSDEDLVGKTALLVDDDARNIFALSSVLERRGMRVLTATTGREAIALVESNPNIAIVLMDIMMPQMDGYQTMASSARTRVRPPADHRADRQGDEGRPREMPGGRRFGLSGQARQHRAVAPRLPHVAAPLIGDMQMMDQRKRSTSCWSTISRRSCSPMKSS